MLKQLCSEVYSFKTKYVIGDQYYIENGMNEKAINIHFWLEGSDNSSGHAAKSGGHRGR